MCHSSHAFHLAGFDSRHNQEIQLTVQTAKTEIAQGALHHICKAGFDTPTNLMFLAHTAITGESCCHGQMSQRIQDCPILPTVKQWPC